MKPCCGKKCSDKKAKWCLTSGRFIDYYNYGDQFDGEQAPVEGGGDMGGGDMGGGMGEAVNRKERREASVSGRLERSTSANARKSAALDKLGAAHRRGADTTPEWAEFEAAQDEVTATGQAHSRAVARQAKDESEMNIAEGNSKSGVRRVKQLAAAARSGDAHAMSKLKALSGAIGTGVDYTTLAKRREVANRELPEVPKNGNKG